MTKLARALKGVYLFLMFALFGVTILVVAFVLLPLLRLIDLLGNPNPQRMQRAHGFLFSIFLWLLSLGGLLRAKRFRQKLPSKPFVVVANHPGLFDVLVLIRDIPRLSVFVKGSLIKRLPLKRVFQAARYVVVSRLGGFTGLESLDAGAAVLKEGFNLLLFPEGTRSPKNNLLRFKAGAFKIAQLAEVPILPVLIKNKPPFLPHEDKWYYPPLPLSRFEIEVWAPISPPAAGTERKAALELENRYREALSLPLRKKRSRAQKKT